MMLLWQLQVDNEELFTFTFKAIKFKEEEEEGECVERMMGCGGVGSGGRHAAVRMVVAAAVMMLVMMMSAVEGVRFELASAAERCVLDQLRKDQLATGEYEVKTESNEVDVDISVTGPRGDEVFERRKTSSGQFGFTAEHEGWFKVCFKNNDMVEHLVSIKFRSGIEAKDLAEVVQRDHLQPLSAEVLRIQETLVSIRQDMVKLKQVEADMRDLNELTNSRTAWFSFFSVAVVSSLGIWQILHLKSYFAEKKII